MVVSSGADDDGLCSMAVTLAQGDIAEKPFSTTKTIGIAEVTYAAAITCSAAARQA